MSNYTKPQENFTLIWSETSSGGMSLRATFSKEYLQALLEKEQSGTVGEFEKQVACAYRQIYEHPFPFPRVSDQE